MKCYSCKRNKVVVVDRRETRRLVGNNFDVVTYEREYFCLNCAHTQYESFSRKENIKPGYKDLDEYKQYKTSPTRHDT